MQTITTQYFGPTNKRGSRIKATASGCGFSVYMPISPEWSIDRAHAEACRALMVKLGWKGTMQSGCTKKGKVWVFTNKGDDTVTVK